VQTLTRAIQFFHAHRLAVGLSQARPISRELQRRGHRISDSP
jgi:hypothetical protein